MKIEIIGLEKFLIKIVRILIKCLTWFNFMMIINYNYYLFYKYSQDYDQSKIKSKNIKENQEAADVKSQERR